MSTANNQPTTEPVESDHAALEALTNQLIEIVTGTPSHQMMLVALIGVYKAIAVVHPCCTAMAAKAALQIGGELLVKSLKETPTGPVH